MFINADSVLGVLDMYRLIWISGRFGGHKTALAYAIAERYLKQGYRLVTNNHSAWSDDLDLVQLDKNNQLKSVVLLDEGGLYFKNSRQIEMIAAYAAKMDCIYLIPSFFPPTKSAQIVNIQPIVSLKATGLPIILYKWAVNIGSFKERGFFIWWRPQEIYGVYSRQDPGKDPEEIIEFLINRSNQFRSAYGREQSNQISGLTTISEADKILEASEVFSSVPDDIATIFERKYRKR